MLGLGGGNPLGPTGCFVSAGLFSVVAIYLLIVALRSKKGELRWGRGGDGALMPLSSALVWFLNALLWAICFLAQGLRFAPIQTRSFWLIGGGFGLLVLAAVRDGLRARRQ